MALPTTNVRLLDFTLDLGAISFNHHFTPKAQKALYDPPPQLHLLTGIGARDARHRAFPADIGNPRFAGWIGLNQLTDLLIAAAIEVGVVIPAFLSIWGTHADIIQ